MKPVEYERERERWLWVDEQPLSLPVAGASMDAFENYRTTGEPEQTTVSDFLDRGDKDGKEADFTIFANGGENE